MTSPLLTHLTDSLTGLYNRPSLSEVLAREVAWADRHQNPLTMLLMDVDHFKQVNDAHGHAVGDGVLKSLGTILRTSLRRVDFVFRYGGEDLCILLPVTNFNGGLCVRQRLRSNIETSEVWAALGYGIRPTVTFGVCGHVVGETTESFITRADQALLRAKRGGGDEGEAGVPARI